MKNIRIIARFLLILMLSVCIMPFSALTVEAKNTDENEEFLQEIAGTYTWVSYHDESFKSAGYWTSYIDEGYSSADEYRKAKKAEREEAIKESGDGQASLNYIFVIRYAMSYLELNVDSSGNISGKHTGKIAP